MVVIFTFQHDAYSKCSKILNTLVFRAGIHKIPVRIANREYPDQTVSEAV